MEAKIVFGREPTLQVIQIDFSEMRVINEVLTLNISPWSKAIYNTIIYKVGKLWSLPAYELLWYGS